MKNKGETNVDYGHTVKLTNRSSVSDFPPSLTFSPISSQVFSDYILLSEILILLQTAESPNLDILRTKLRQACIYKSP